jgi:hypothetical protein
LHYEYYDSLEAVELELEQQADAIQCIIAQPDALKAKTFPFGKSQEPALWDYPDGVDSMAFLLSLN